MEKKRTDPSLDDIESFLPQPFTAEEKDMIRRWQEKQDPGAGQAFVDQTGREIAAHVLSQTRPVRKLTLFRMGIAATVALLILSTIYVLFRPEPRMLVFVNQTASVQSVVLADGTRVWVNRGSMLEYPESFGKAERVCRLRNGEAFFDVVRNPAQPFRVETGAFSVRVLGTSFNIRLGRATASVTVATGKVKVQSPETASDTLRPNDQLVLSGGHFSVRHVDAAEASAWRSGQIYLEDVSFEELINAVEAAYDIHITYPDRLRTQNASLHFSVSDPLPELLDIIAGIYHVHYQQNGKEVRLK